MNGAFGKRLKDIRTERKILQKAFAQVCHISPAYLSDIERGRRNPPSAKVIREWARSLDASQPDRLAGELIEIALRDRGALDPVGQLVPEEVPEGREYVATTQSWPLEQQGDASFFSQVRKDLTASANEGRLDPWPGQGIEFLEIARVMARCEHNSVALTSQSRVDIQRFMGGLALRIANVHAPRPLSGRRLLAIDPGALLAGTKYRGQLEERLGQLLGEAEESGDILCFPSLKDLVRLEEKATGSFVGRALQDSLVHFIVGTLPGEAEWGQRNAPEILECLKPVPIRPLSREEVLRGLFQLRERYGAYHGVTYSEEALYAVLDAAEQGGQEGLWHRALDILDNVGVGLRTKGLEG